MRSLLLLILLTTPLLGDRTEWGWDLTLMPHSLITGDQYTPRMGLSSGYEIYDIDYRINLTTTGDHIGVFAVVGWDKMFYILDIHPYFGYRLYGGYHNGAFESAIHSDTGVLYHFYNLWKPLKIGFAGRVALIYREKTFTPALMGGLVIRIALQ